MRKEVMRIRNLSRDSAVLYPIAETRAEDVFMKWIKTDYVSSLAGNLILFSGIDLEVGVGKEEAMKGEIKLGREKLRSRKSKPAFQTIYVHLYSFFTMF